MKKMMIRTATLVVVLVVMASVLFVVPVSAMGQVDEDGTEWWEHGLGWMWGEYWGYINTQAPIWFEDWANQHIEWSAQHGLSPSSFMTQSRNFYTSSGNPSGGGGGGVRGDIPTPSGGGGGGVRGHVDGYANGNTTTHSVVNYNTTTNSYTFNMPTYNEYNTTNNYYETYNIRNIYHNTTYNTYRFETTNNYNYYITYSPTYINITYLDSAGSDELRNYTYYYQLPDGRNSWDLNADEVYGMYFMYDAVNYDMVIEDEATLALYHFDGTIKDDSAYRGSANYTVGASYNYVDHGNFDSALYWDGGSHELVFNLPSGVSSSGTIEYMLYMSHVEMNYINVPTAMVLTDLPEGGPVSSLLPYFGGQNSNIKCGAGVLGEVFERQGEWVDIIDFMNNITIYATERCQEHRFKVQVPFVSVLGFGESILAGWCYEYEYVLTYHDQYVDESYTQVSQQMRDLRTKKWITYTSSVVGVKTYGAENLELPIGSWNHLAYTWGSGGGKFFLNGLPVNVGAESLPAISGNSVSINKSSVYNNYWYIDEFRVSNKVLYTSSYQPQAHPFDTNKVMVLPESGNAGDIAIKSNIPVRSFRVGGARPTYPLAGDVFISVAKDGDKHTVESVQQYQAGGWTAVDGSVRQNDKWVSLKNYDLKSMTINETDVPDPGDGGTGGGEGGGGNGGGDSGGDGGGEEEGGGFWGWLFGIIGDFLGGIVDALGKLITGILNKLLSLVVDLVNGIVDVIVGLFDALFSLVDFATRFGDFIGAAFTFLPGEIVAVIVVGLSLAIILMIINFFR